MALGHIFYVNVDRCKWVLQGCRVPSGKLFQIPGDHTGACRHPFSHAEGGWGGGRGTISFGLVFNTGS